MGLNSLVLLTSNSNAYIGALGTIAGMGVVFLTLILIAFIISGFKYIGRTSNKQATKVVVEKKVPVMKASPEPVKEEDDLELVAVITAAIAATMGTSSDRLVVKSLRRVGGNRSGWNATGRQESVNNNF